MWLSCIISFPFCTQAITIIYSQVFLMNGPISGQGKESKSDFSFKMPSRQRSSVKSKAVWYYSPFCPVPFIPYPYSEGIGTLWAVETTTTTQTEPIPIYSLNPFFSLRRMGKHIYILNMFTGKTGDRSTQVRNLFTDRFNYSRTVPIICPTGAF